MRPEVMRALSLWLRTCVLSKMYLKPHPLTLSSSRQVPTHSCKWTTLRLGWLGITVIRMWISLLTQRVKKSSLSLWSRLSLCNAFPSCLKWGRLSQSPVRLSQTHSTIRATGDNSCFMKCTANSLSQHLRCHLVIPRSSQTFFHHPPQQIKMSLSLVRELLWHWGTFQT